MSKIFLIPNVLSEDSSVKMIPEVVKETISGLEYFFVEDIRNARRYISSLKLGKKIEELHFFELNKDTPIEEVKKYFQAVPAKSSIGIISEAGCPGVADPGALAVREAHRIGRQVVPLPGPSSILMALMASGLSGQSFTFHGYLPIDKEQRANAVKALEKDARKKNQSQIFMETPYRNDALLQDLFQLCQPDTLLTIAADITSPQEFICTRRIVEWKKQFPALHKKPVIFVLGF